MPAKFRRSLAQHDRHCWFGAALSLLGALLAWLVLGLLYTGAVLLFETVRTGNPSLFTRPVWYAPLACGIAFVLLSLAGIDTWIHRFRSVSDRSIIGWHLIPEVLLLPPRLTLAVWNHLQARVLLDRYECEEAWRLLQTILRLERASAQELTQEFSDTRLLMKLLLSLQLTGWIDFFGTKGAWYYRVRSDEEIGLRALIVGSTQEGEDSTSRL